MKCQACRTAKVDPRETEMSFMGTIDLGTPVEVWTCPLCDRERKSR